MVQQHLEPLVVPQMQPHQRPSKAGQKVRTTSSVVRPQKVVNTTPISTEACTAAKSQADTTARLVAMVIEGLVVNLSKGVGVRWCYGDVNNDLGRI